MKAAKRFALAKKDVGHDTPACSCAVVTVNTHEVSESPLLKLPAELRELIYKFTVARDDEHNALEVTKEKIHEHTHLMRTCRQIREEATDVFFRTVRFRIVCGLGTGATAVRWLESRGANAARIRCYEIAFDGATQLRHRFASSRKHAILDCFSHRLARRIRDKAYQRSYWRFVEDYVAVSRYMSRYVETKRAKDAESSIPFLMWDCCAPMSRLRLRIDEYHYMDLIGTVLRDGGWVL